MRITTAWVRRIEWYKNVGRKEFVAIATQSYFKFVTNNYVYEPRLEALYFAMSLRGLKSDRRSLSKSVSRHRWVPKLRSWIPRLRCLFQMHSNQAKVDFSPLAVLGAAALSIPHTVIHRPVRPHRYFTVSCHPRSSIVCVGGLWKYNEVD